MKLKPETLLKRFKTFCVLDGRRIPQKRHRRNAVTCSRDCQKRLTKLRKLARDHRQCSHCGRPSTPQERGDFRRWRGSKDIQAQPRKAATAKGIRSAAMVTPKVDEIAYVVTAPPKSRRKKGAAA